MPDKLDPTRRDVVKIAGAAAAAFTAAPAIVKAAPEQMKFGIIGTGGRGSYLLKHLTKIDNGHCAAVCDLDDERLNKAAVTIGTNPTKYKDYRELLADKNCESVIVAVPLFEHYRVTRDALLAGKHVFCEKSLVFKPEEIHLLRALVAQHPKQLLQVGLQRRYSKFYQIAKQMVDKGLLGNVTHIHAQWHRNPGWVMNGFNWRLYKQFSGGLAAELASHQIDISDWMFGSSPEFVMGLGGLDTWHDGRDVFDNIQLIYKYPKNQKLVYSSITTNSHMPYLNSTRPEFGEIIMGTAGSLELTVGDGEATMPTALWYRETAKAVSSPPPLPGQPAPKEKPAAAGASFALGAGQKGMPIALATDQLKVGSGDSFIEKEKKFAQRWLYTKGIMTDDEDRNPVETQLESFFNDARTMKKPLADLEVGLADSTAVMLSNLCMEQDRKVYFKEIETLGKNVTPQQMETDLQKAEASYKASLANRKYSPV
jgi:predicted dehydrogenase